MHYNFNIYCGRKMFNLNFSARTDKQAIADARIWFLISLNFDGYVGIVHRRVASGERASRILPNRLSQCQTRTTSRQSFTLTKMECGTPSPPLKAASLEARGSRLQVRELIALAPVAYPKTKKAPTGLFTEMQ